MTNKHRKSLYITALKAVKGEIIVCPGCGNQFTKSTYNQKFCRTFSKTICKDLYYNNVVETKRDNRTRISPVNALRREQLMQEHPFSSEALGQWTDL